VPDPRDDKLDLSASSQPQDRRPGAVGARPYISVHFACCGVYLRIYRSADGKSYSGRCPRCARPVRFVVGPGGTDARMFVVH
jgi:hypothetical protein